MTHALERLHGNSPKYGTRDEGSGDKAKKQPYVLLYEVPNGVNMAK
jgi:hypothetical protein